MVARIVKFFAYTLFFLLALMYFTPKLGLYYLLEEKLSEKNIIINNEALKDNGFSLSIYDASVNVKSIESATIKEIDLKIFGLYNAVHLKEITLASVAASMVPTKIDTIMMHYSVLDPVHLKAKASGEFGDAQMELDLLDLAVHLELHPSKKMLSSYRGTLRDLKKTKEGAYTYDKTFKF